MTIFKKVVCSLVVGTLAIGFDPGISAAGELRLDGPLVQGGLLTGHTEPGARVTVDGRNLRVSDRGVFLIGFGRDASLAGVEPSALSDGICAPARAAKLRRAPDRAIMRHRV